MRREHGFAPLLLYGAIGAGAIIVVMGIALKMQSSRLETCQADKAKVEAAYEVLAQKVEEQNEAIEQWEKTAKDRSDGARKALAAERARGVLIKTELERLKTLLSDSKGKTCQNALEDLRRGLR